MQPKLNQKSVDFSLTFCTLNVKGQQNLVKRKQQYQWARSTKSDVIFMQETHSTRTTETFWKNEWGGNCLVAHGESNSRGVAILFRKGLPLRIVEKEADSNGRYIWAKVEIQGNCMGLLNIYAPNSAAEQIIFYQQIIDLLQDKQNNLLPIMVGGDFNCVINPQIDKKGGNIGNPKEKVLKKIQDIMEGLSIIDIWRAKNPNEKQYTWSQSKPAVHCRLDLWLVPVEWLQITKICKIGPAVSTDHKAVFCKIEGKNFRPRGPGIWKMNTSILQEKEYIEKVQEIIIETREEGTEADPRITWGFLKSMISGYTQDYCRSRAKKKRERERRLQNDLERLEQTLHELKQEEIDEYKKCKEEYEKLYEDKARGAIIRSRANWIANGEKNTKYFLGLEKTNYNRLNINQLIVENGNTVEDQSELMSFIHSYYQQLYEDPEVFEEEESMKKFLNKIPTQEISESEFILLEQPITLLECEQALFSMAEGKAPGMDGIPVEFYKQFWSQIKNDFLNMVNTAFQEEQLYGHVTQGVLRLLPKPEKNLLHLKNWRPITLLNVDYKILSKVLAKRLEQIIPNLIHEDQTGFVKGRYIGQSIRTLLDVAEHCEINDVPALMVSLDIEKAFDSVRWPFLCEILERRGIGPRFLKWIALLYGNSRSCVINNGHLTRNFTLQKGVRQGDPLSPFLFILAIEVLSDAIRLNNEISGITINEDIFKIIQFADDTTVLLQDESSLLKLNILLDQYSEFSGLKVNQAKTVVMGLGKWKNRSDCIHNFRVSPKASKLLGIWFSHDKTQMHNLNVGGKMERMKKVLNSWHTRGLTLQGRITVVKSLGISQMVYPLMNTVVPEKALTEINKVVYEFIWQGMRRIKIKQNVLMQDYRNGGLKAPDIYSSYQVWKFSWLNRLINMENNKWKNLITKEINKMGGLEYLLACNYDTNVLRHTSKMMNGFIRELIEIHAEIAHGKERPKGRVPLTFIKNQIINNNRYILSGGKSLFIKQLVDANPDQIDDWVNSQRRFYSYTAMQVLGAQIHRLPRRSRRGGIKKADLQFLPTATFKPFRCLGICWESGRFLDGG